MRHQFELQALRLQFVKEIENVKAFFANRQGGGAGSDPALKKGFVDALMKLVALCPSINAENGKLVHDALKVVITGRPEPGGGPALRTNNPASQG